MEQHYPFTLPPLPYGYDALAPELIEKVLYFHHDKHFAAYVDALNQLLERTPAYQSWPLWKLCLNWEELPDGLRQGVRNNAGGVFNHDLYFRTLHPLPVSAPDMALEGAVVRDFGGMAGLKEAMRKAALGQFGSGWAWLSADGEGHLAVQKTANQDTPLPLIPCCVATYGSTPTISNTRIAGRTTSKPGGDWWTGLRSPGSIPAAWPAVRPGPDGRFQRRRQSPPLLENSRK